MVNDFEEEVKALEEYGHDCCARIDDRIHECCKRIREAHEQELDNTRYAYEVSLALMKKQPSPLGDPYGIWKGDGDGMDAGGRVETGGGRSDAAADGHMADSAGSQVSEGLAPITVELRDAVEWEPTFCGPDKAMVPQPEFDRICDAIDAVHAGLERENAELRERLAVLNESADSMHDGGSITDELRAWVRDGKGSLLAVADRIDAEHERQLEVLYRDMSDAEYVNLHKDTGGEYIREHDKVDWRDHAGAWHENATVVAVCDDGCYVMDGTVFHVHKSDIRHYHEPTVEDVLFEFARFWSDEELTDIEHLQPHAAQVIAEFASKLRLAGSDAE